MPMRTQSQELPKDPAGCYLNAGLTHEPSLTSSAEKQGVGQWRMGHDDAEPASEPAEG